ncbi:MAG: InlB B-repeat-containing protein, partial [Clostridiaceae bacterium]|nr:InlB B-repeat-containing protein [Clostridiaceae bacterium]MDY5889351.1 InlB B-repeat-containing protein [Oscillospiraceae bacterium]
MAKRMGKKAVSFILTFVLLVTTFFVFDPSILFTESKAVVDVQRLVNTVEPTVKFYVPEAIYLNPIVGSGTEKYSFQFFIDCDENGTLRRSATQTTGTVYFSCSAACSSISISWENSTVTATTNTSTNQIFKQTVTGGRTSVSDGRVKVTCTYVVDGVTYYAYAYTYMYYPDLDLLTGAVGSYVYKTSIGNEPKLAAFSFITGVHYVGNTTTYNDTERGVNNYYDQYTTDTEKGAYGLSPLIPNWSTTAQFKTAADNAVINDNEIVYGETTVGNSKFIVSGNGGVYFRARQRDDSKDKYIGSSTTSWGNLYVDSSRVTNYNQIPNLRGGFICHFYASSGEKGSLQTFQTTDGAITVMSNIDYRNGDGKGYGMTSSEALYGTPENKAYTMRANYMFQRSNSSTVHFLHDFGLNVYLVNKGSLRNLYREVIENGWQSATASRNGWSSSAQSSWTSAYNTFASALDTAGTILGKPYATASEVTSAYNALNSAKTACDNIVNNNFTGGENSAVLPQVYFYVPETIYLNPSDNQTFQYFYGVETNGVPAKNISLSTAQSGARIYFAGKNCSPSSVKITVQSSYSSATTWTSTSTAYLSSITYGGQSFTGSTASSTGVTYSSFPVNIQCTAGKMNSAVTAAGYRFLKWTAQYVVDGITYYTYAYTVCYAPYDQAVTASTRAYNDRGVESDMQSIAWIVGVTGSNTDGNRGINQSSFNPIKGVIPVPTNTNNSGGISQDGTTYTTGSSGTSRFENRSGGTGDSDQGAQAVAPTGKLTLDSTRFSNLQYVPNFKIGFIISYVNEGSASVNRRRFGYYFSDISSTSFDSPSGYGSTDWNLYNRDGVANRGTYIVSDTSQEATNGTVTREYCRPRLVYNSTWNKEVTSSTTVRIIGAARFGTRKKSNDRTSNSNNANIVPLAVTVVNKSSLRSAVQNAVSAAKQQSWYATGYDIYQNSILTMAINLGEPSRTATTGAVDEENLVRNSGTTTAVHRRHPDYGADYNGNTGDIIIGTETESKNYSYGDKVYGYYNDIIGFTKRNYSVTYGSTTKTSGLPQESANNNYYYIKNANTSNVDWTFYYIPNTYTVTYDPNLGTYNGTEEASSNTVLFQSKYTVAYLNGTTPADPTRPGCTFDGWKCSADGLIYRAGDTINWEFAEDVTFTAQWIYNSYYTYYNENHDGLTANLLTPDLDADLNVDTTASISSINGSGETVITQKPCNMVISQVGNGTLKINGTVAGNYTIAIMPITVEAGKTYTISSELLSGSVSGGCMVIDFLQENGSNISPRLNYDFSGSGSKTITFTEEQAASIASYKIWMWYNSNSSYDYLIFDNFTFKPRIEETVTRTDSDIFSDYLQYGRTYETLPTPYREGYTFDGWFTAASGGTQVQVGSATPYENTTLYAHWTINQYKLTYDNEFDFDNFDFVNSTYPKTSGGSTVTVNEKENSISFTSSGDDDYTRTGQEGTPASTGYLTLVPGHTYQISYDYTVSSQVQLNCHIFTYTSTDSTSWVNSSSYITASGTSSTSFTYTIPSGRPYAKLRFGIGTSGVTATFKNICVRDLTDPMNYKASDGINPSLDKTSDTVAFNDTQSPLAAITRQGYTFKGWFQSSNTSNGNGYGTQFTTSTAMPARDVPLFAQWALNDYQIIINLNADSTDKATIGSFNYSKASNTASTGAIALSSETSSQQTVTSDITPISVAYGTSFALPIPSRPGYTFAGWTANTTPNYASLTNNGNSSASSYRVGAGGVTLTAQWTKNNYRVNAYAYGDIYSSAAFESGRGGTVKIGTGTAATSVYSDIPYRSTVTLTANPSEGYAFVGWYSDSSLTTLVSSNATFTSAPMGINGLNYYAKFKVQSYTITVDPNGATAGTTLSGWYTAAGTQASSQTITASTNITMVYGSTLTLTVPKRTGYTFGGWEKTSGVGTLTYSATANSTFVCSVGTAAIKAKWTANKLIIKFNGNSSTSGSMSDQSFTYDQTQNLTANSFIKQYTITFNGNGGTINGSSFVTDIAKWSFNGWNSSANGSGAYSYTNSQAVTNPCGLTENNSSATLYAKWTGGNLQLKTAIRDGYTFVGWATTSTAEKPTYTVNQTLNFTSDSTLYAVWVETATANQRVEEVEVVTGITVTNNDLSYEPILKIEKKYVYVQDETYSALCEAFETAYSNFNTSKTLANASVLVDARKALDSYIAGDYKYDAPVKNYIEEFKIEYLSGVNRPIAAGIHKLSDLNLNHYTSETLSTSPDSILQQMNLAKAVTSVTQQGVINNAVKKIAQNYLDKKTVSTAPSYKVYENEEKIKNELSANEDVTAVNYVNTAFDGITYYCYTNKINPTVYLTVEDGDSSGRICYPTRSKMDSTGIEASVLGGTIDSNVKVDYSVSTRSISNSVYNDYFSAGMGNTYTGNVNGQSFSGIDYYSQQSIVELNPSFTSGKNGAAKYVVTSTDDSYNAAESTMGSNYAKTASLSSGKTAEKVATKSEQSITIVIDYHPGDAFDVNGDQVQNDKWLKQFHIMRTSGGARNWEFPRPQEFTNPNTGKAYDEYLVDDTTYGQEDLGSFTFTFMLGSSIDLTTKKVLNDGNIGYLPTLNTKDPTAIANAIKDGTISFSDLKACQYTGTKSYYKVLENGDYEKDGSGKIKVYYDGTGYGFFPWPKANGWSFNYYPASGAYTYVHLVDRWGNVVDKVIEVGLQDPKDIKVNTSAMNYTV